MRTHESNGLGTALRELVPLIDAIPFYGPPALLIGLPWALFALMLVGPFAVLVTIVVLLVAAGLLILALVASPYLLFRHLRSARQHHSTSHA
jgi:hypothetical protein